MESSKQYQINKRIVYLAYRKVKANKGSPGIDGIGIEDYEKNLKNNLYKLWNRMSSGSYFPKPVMAVEIPKKNGGVRVLGIPTIEDRIAQMTATLYIEPILNPLFHCCAANYLQLLKSDYPQLNKEKSMGLFKI